MGVNFTIDEKTLTEVIDAAYELPKLTFKDGGYGYTTAPSVITVPNTGTVWSLPAPTGRTLKIGEHEFLVHGDGTVHLDPEAFVELLRKAGLT